ncbi:hypothetical protein [Leisingera sp. JC11]|uniref:hypothetical protein n=1 Tax=Leisingera sp. JC11 TaxID=3042469 RepID=UPI003456B04A
MDYRIAALTVDCQMVAANLSLVKKPSIKPNPAGPESFGCGAQRRDFNSYKSHHPNI